MHEIAIVEGLIGLLDKQKKLHQFSRVNEIHVACGVYNCISEESLNFCLQALAERPYLKTAVIKIRRLPERWSCSKCRTEFVREGKESELVCTKCGSVDVVPLLNSEIYLDKLEVD